MRRLIQITILIAGTFTAHATAATTVSDNDRFQLWNNCGPVSLLINYNEVLPKKDKEKIETAVSGQLRNASIYGGSSGNTAGFLVSATVRDRGRYHVYHINTSLLKKVQDLQTELTSFTATWHHSIGGNSTKGMEDVVQKFIILTDIFIDNYLRVNADACKRSN